MMSAKTLALLLSLGVVPAVALAQSAPPPAPPAQPAPAASVNPGGPMQWSPEMRAHMEQMRTQMRAHMEEFRSLREQTRTRMLDSLSASHRLAVAHILGELAVSPNPDRRTAARQIDAILSPSERTAILAAHESAMQRMRGLMEQFRAQMQSAHAHMQQFMHDMHGRMQQMHQQWQQGHHHEHHTPTAGDVLVRSLGR